jgi:hypothetical protein
MLLGGGIFDFSNDGWPLPQVHGELPQLHPLPQVHGELPQLQPPPPLSLHLVQGLLIHEHDVFIIINAVNNTHAIKRCISVFLPNIVIVLFFIKRNIIYYNFI